MLWGTQPVLVTTCHMTSTVANATSGGNSFACHRPSGGTKERVLVTPGVLLLKVLIGVILRPVGNFRYRLAVARYQQIVFEKPIAIALPNLWLRCSQRHTISDEIALLSKFLCTTVNKCFRVSQGCWICINEYLGRL